jgi:hypothetical protein
MSAPDETASATRHDPPTATPPGDAAWKDKGKVPLYKRIIPFVVATALVGYVVRKMDLHAFLVALSHLNYIGYAVFTVAWTLVVCAGDSLGTVAAYRPTTPNVRFGEFYVMRGASYLPSILNHHLGQAFLTYLMSRFFNIPIGRMAGATLLSYASWMGCLLGCMVVALPFTNLPQFYAPAIVGAGVVYLIVIGIAPARLRKISFLAPLFEAGIKGHALALAARVPHLLVLVLGAWVSFLFFHVDIPIQTAAVYLPILLVAVTLPITPQGAGTRDAIAGVFFAAFAPGATDAERVANVAASTATWTISNTIMCIVMGLICGRIVSRRLADLGTEVKLGQKAADAASP